MPSPRLDLRWSLLPLVLLAAAVGSAAESTPDGPRPAEPTPIDKPRLAAWSFDEPSGTVCRDTSGHGCDAASEPSRPAGIARVPGVFGQALSLTGNHLLRVEKPMFGPMAEISLSVWTRPTDLSRYREIFRKEDGNDRVLFSFQENGTILSLGLNVGGYTECDARLHPARVLDGNWHHCAATFDGRVMRVYLDGKQIASRERQGTITAGGRAPGCIGSSSGGECFQGAIDDLRIYGAALTAEQVTLLYRSGLEALERASPELHQLANAVYVPGSSLAEALAGSRKSLVQHNLQTNHRLIGAIANRLQIAYPEPCENFITWTGTGLLEYFTAKGNDFHLRQAGRLVDLLLEYKPLTAHQWKRQSPDELRRWEEAETIRKRFDALSAQGETSQFSPEWIAVILEAGKRIQFRPQVAEAVAPYVKPETPATRTLTAAEGRETLERDWLYQADQKPTPERIKQELAWTRQLAERIAANHSGKVDFAGALAQLDALAAQAAALTAPDQGLYFKVREVKRSVALKNPAVDFDRLLFVDMPFPQGSEWRHETRHRLGYMAVPGARLLVLEGLSPAGKLRQLMPQAPLHGSFWRPDLSYDAQKVLFCFKPHNEKSFHLYEINVDGTGLVQLTDGIYDDLDPIYLPDGHLLFSTTRGHTYVRCMPQTNAYMLARCDSDGRNVYLVSANNEPDYLPSMMHDGRVIYTRWEYTDKPLWRAQGLWTVNPDGTQVNTYWGNQSVWPDLLKDVRCIPGSRRVMFTGSAHHNWFAGSVGLIDPDHGYNFPDGLTKITADVGWPESGNGPVDPIESPRYHRNGKYTAYYSPYPLGEQDFLVSAERGGKFLLYLMDVDGNRELIYEGVHNIFHAMPLKPRPRPPVLVDRVAWPSRAERLNPQGGVIFSGNVYQGAPDELRGKAKYLRVLNIEHKTYTYWHKRPYLSTGPVVSIVQSEGVKRIMGTVPIQSDGSVAFHVPAGQPLHFQLLDEHYQALQTMRSFANVMPGERRGCLGCHESHSRAPVIDGKFVALAKPPRTITPPPWSDDTVSYPRYVQPVLDKYCGKCHQGTGEAVKTVDLTPRAGFLDFAEPYFLLTGRPSWGQAYQKPKAPAPGFGIANVLMVEGYSTTDPAAYRTPKPMTYLSHKSRLIELCSSGKHYDVKVDDLSLQRLIAWIDAMCPYCGDEEIRAIPDPDFQGVDWLSIRPRIHTAPRIVRPGPVD
ncbi:MAG: LamG-like jellyroll fold domain-containing protein [Thermoguttaceae bacterium]